MTLRVGSVPYLVGRPLDLELEHAPGVELERRVPAELVARLRAGELDCALVSSIELFRSPGCRWLEGLAVAGRGTVDSVQVFLRRPLEQVRRVALDPASRAAATLVRVLLAERDDGGPELLEVAAGQDPRAADADGWLRIGDAALRETLLEDHRTWNPSAEWCARTGLPFVFASWLVRPGVDVASHLPAFRAARRRGAARAAELADEAAPRLGLEPADVRRYLLEQCLYEPTPAEQRSALERFGERARALGLAHAEAEPSPIPMPDPATPEDPACRA